MRSSQYPLCTLKEIPSDAELISHQLMLRAGMIRKVASGLYTWLPTGLRVLRKVENIVREEMNNVNAIELSMPIVQPATLWKESGRWMHYGAELLRFMDRSKRSFVLSPTHEEAITDLIRNEVRSYKELPLSFFQIQTKFRDEVRPRFGIMRAREFLMKDAYSFHTSQDCLKATYDVMRQAYRKIFSRMGLDVRAIHAETGSIGGISSHEFQALADSGEDDIVLSTNSEYAANINLVKAPNPIQPREAAREMLRVFEAPNVKTINEFAQKFQLPIEKIVKTFLVRATRDSNLDFIALLVRGDHTLNKIKAEQLEQVSVPLTFATEEDIRAINGVDFSCLGPMKLPFPLIADFSVAVMSDFITGANLEGKYYLGINWERDLPIPQISDIRNVIDGDPSPDGKGTLLIKRGIEVGHVFQLSTKYSEAMKATVQGTDGCPQLLIMGCYGIGLTRVVAAIIEQHYDERGIIWPDNVSPFQLAILPIHMHQFFHVQKLAEELYATLRFHGVDVLLDDRKERPGVMFSDMDLIGLPHSIVIGDCNLKIEQVEYKNRRTGEKQMIKTSEVVDFLLRKIKR